MHAAYPDRYPLSPRSTRWPRADEPVSLAHEPRSVDELTSACSRRSPTRSAGSLDDGVVAEAADVDTCLLLGAGFPFFLGGITPHLDATGVSQRVAGRPFGAISAPGSAQEATPRAACRARRSGGGGPGQLAQAATGVPTSDR